MTKSYLSEKQLGKILYKLYLDCFLKESEIIYSFLSYLTLFINQIWHALTVNSFKIHYYITVFI